MIANTLEILSSPRAKKDKKTSKSPLSLQPRIVPNQKRDKLSTFSQLLGEAKESKKPKNSSKTSLPTARVSVRKQNEIPSNLTPTLAPMVVVKQEENVILQPQKNIKKSTRIARVGKHSIAQSTQEQLLLQKQIKTPTNTKKQIQTPLNEVLTQARKPKAQQKGTKTLGDVAKIAQELNLTKLEVKSQEPQSKPMHNVITQSKKEVKHPSLENLLRTPSKEKPQRLSQNTKVRDLKEVSKNIQTRLKPQAPLQPLEQPQILSQPQIQENTQEKVKDFSLAELLKVSPKEKTPSFELKEEGRLEEKPKETKTQDLALGELKRDTQFKIASSKESFTQFSQRIREEVLNYKPPFTKLSMELNPVELGKLEITITKKGKELVVNVNANNPNALHAFMQNQSEFRATLSNVGFSNVELNFSQGEGKGGNPQEQRGEQKRNKNSLEETITEIPALASMEIKMVQYA